MRLWGLSFSVAFFSFFFFLKLAGSDRLSQTFRAVRRQACDTSTMPSSFLSV